MVRARTGVDFGYRVQIGVPKKRNGVELWELLARVKLAWPEANPEIPFKPQTMKCLFAVGSETRGARGSMCLLLSPSFASRLVQVSNSVGAPM